jgi:hypothetical protein
VDFLKAKKDRHYEQYFEKAAADIANRKRREVQERERNEMK